MSIHVLYSLLKKLKFQQINDKRYITNTIQTSIFMPKTELGDCCPIHDIIELFEYAFQHLLNFA